MRELFRRVEMKRRKKRMASYSSSDSSDSDSGSSSDAYDSDSSSSSDAYDSDSSSSSDAYDSDGSSSSDTYDSDSSSSSDTYDSEDVDSDSDSDDSYLSSRYAKDESYLISDEIYAQELQLQEALMFSASKTNASSSSQKDAPSSSKKSVKEEPSSKKWVKEEPLSKKSVKEEPSSSIAATSSTKNPLKRKRGTVKSEAAKLPKSLCGICMDTKAPSEMFSNGKVCRHQFCLDCIRGHISVKIKENIVKVTCPEPQCKGLIRPELCRSIVPKEVLERWEDALCESLILGTQKFYCPFKDCSALLADDGGEAITSSECPNCNRLFCAQCKVAWHSGMNCREYKSLKKDERNPEDISLRQLAKKKKWKRCPYCKFMVEKRDGCNHISCRCGHDFCYRCGKKDKYGTHVCRSRDVSP